MSNETNLNTPDQELDQPAADAVADATEVVEAAPETVAVAEEATDVAHVSDGDASEVDAATEETVVEDVVADLDADMPAADEDDEDDEALLPKETRYEVPVIPELSGDDALAHHGTMKGYTGEIRGRTITLAELQQIEKERAMVHGALSEDDLMKLYEGSLSAVVEGEIVKGRIVGINEKEYVIDIGFKSDGLVARNEFPEELALGDDVEVYLERLEDRRGQLQLSKNKADDYRRWSTIQDAFENGTVVEGTIVRRIKGGMIVDLLGAEAFLPGSQIDVRPVRDFDVYLGKTMEFKVVKINPTNGNVVVSHKALIEKDLLEQRRQILDTMEPGQILEGTVKNITNFGVFIDLGGVDGLLHITDISWGRVGHPSEVVHLDQKLNIVVLDYDKDRQRISLGLKQLMSHPWENIGEKFVEGMEVEGRVVSITDYGAFVELEKGIEGLVHISEMSWTEHVKHPTQRVQLGQVVQVKILRIDTQEKKISLGMKQLEPDPWQGILERFPLNSVHNGIVRNLTTFGAFVELEPGIDGLVHVSDLSWTKRVKHPSEVVKKGDRLQVQVLDIDVAKRRISLGHKQVQTDPWQDYVSRHAPDTDTTAKVVDILDNGLLVELPSEAEGYVPSGQLERQGRPAEVYEIGQTLTLRVIKLDHDNRQIILSETIKRRREEAEARDAERAEKDAKRREERRAVDDFSKAGSGPATFGELSGLAALKAQMEADEAKSKKG